MSQLTALKRRPLRTSLIAAIAALALLGTSGCDSEGESSAETAKKASATTATYRDYLLEEAERMATWGSQLRYKIKLDIVGGAQSRYASSRVPFGHLKPAMNFFPKLDQRLDASPAGAYPRLERMLWQEESTGSAGLKAASEVLDSTLWFHEEIKTTKLPPQAIIANARHTLDEIATSELQLKADPYSGLDILDASAKLEGVEAAFKAVRPSVLAEDPDLAREFHKQFEVAFAATEAFGIPARKLDQPHPHAPGTSFFISDQLTSEELRPLRDSVERIDALFAQAESVFS